MDSVKYTLKEMRDISDLQIKVIEERSNVSYRSIRNWEMGRNIPSIINVYNLVEVYGFTISDLDIRQFYKGSK